LRGRSRFGKAGINVDRRPVLLDGCIVLATQVQHASDTDTGHERQRVEVAGAMHFGQRLGKASHRGQKQGIGVPNGGSGGVELDGAAELVFSFCPVPRPPKRHRCEKRY
jgi:hypothetical protein